MFALEEGGMMRPLDGTAEAAPCGLYSGLRHAELMLIPDAKIVADLVPAELLEVESALEAIPCLYVLNEAAVADRLAWVVNRLSPFDHFYALKSVADLPESKRISRKISSDKDAMEAMAAADEKPVVALSAGASESIWSSPVVRALALPGLSLSARKAMFFDCRSAVESAVRRALPLHEIIGMAPQVVELGAGLSLTASALGNDADLVCIETEPALAALASEFSPGVVKELSGFVPEDIADSAVIVLNGWQQAFAEPQPLRALAAACIRVIVLEHFDASGTGGYQTYMSSVLDRLARLFPNSSTSLLRMRLIGHKPEDFLAQTALLELEVIR